MDFSTEMSIALGVLGLIVAGLVIGANSEGQGATFRERIFSYSPLFPVLIIHYFLPYGLAIMVLFMDIMSQIPQGIFGLAIAIGVFIINHYIAKPINELPNDLCEIPGLKAFSSKFMPQSLLFVSILVSYLASFVTFSSPGIVTEGTGTSPVVFMSPSPSTRITASWALAGAVILFQAIGLATTPGCLVNMRIPFTQTIISSVVSILLAIGVGVAIGVGSGYGLSTLSITQPSYVTAPSTPNKTTTTQATGPGFVREKFQLGAGLGEMPQPAAQGSQIPVDIAKSSGAVTPGESSDQFVCEAYKNGQLVTSTLIG